MRFNANAIIYYHFPPINYIIIIYLYTDVFPLSFIHVLLLVKVHYNEAAVDLFYRR